MKKRDFGTLAVGMALGAALTGGAAAAGVLAEPSWQNIYVNGKHVQMTAYNIAGHNFVKLRDIGKEVGFNVYWADGVQVDSTTPYTGEAPAKPAAAGSISVSSYKGNTLKAGDRSGLIISPGGSAYTVTSSDPAVIVAEKWSDSWVAVAKSAGSAVITVSNSAGETGRLTLTVETAAADAVASDQTGASSGGVDLTANMEIRQEMIRLINEVRRENGVPDLAVNEALMNAAQDCSAQKFTAHHTEYECKAAMRYGYPHGFGDNLTVISTANIAKGAVSNWVHSPGHFQAMIDEHCDCIGVGVTVVDGRAYCYMFAGDPNSHHPYE